MSPPPVHVFISSTWLDLQPEREAVENALQRMRETKYAGMEYFGSRDEDTRSTSLAEVDRSRVYVGIFGGRYGSGITEAEYRRAREQKLPCFLYLKEERCITSDEREADPDKTHRLMALKDELGRNHTITKFANPHDLAGKVTAHLDRWLFDEYLAPQLEGAAQGHLPRDQTQALLAAIKDSAMLKQGLRERLENARFVLAGDQRSIAVGGSANSSTFITGDHNVVYQTIVRLYPALKDYAYDFSELIDTRTSGFVGREFIFKRLEEFKEGHPCGYLLIVADAGLGKTAIAAEVACRYKAPAFFADASEGLRQPAQCLKHLSAELIARSGLAHDHLPDRAGKDSFFLGRMLAEAAQKASGPLWIVVDALDEADKPSPGENTLLLPRHLPQGVYFLLTHRPGEYLLVTDAGTWVSEYTIAWDAPDQKTDIRTYLLSQAEKPAIRTALAMATPPIPAERFITALEEASEGNFKYLDYVISDIASREPGFVPLKLDTLPRGLKGYYGQFWSHIAPAPEEDRREVREEWEQIYQPVIAFLGAAREPVTAEWLATLVGCSAKKIRERVLRRWQRFLHQDQEQRTWRVVHRSFTDFLAEKMDDEADWRAFHARIADRYLTAWGGLEAGLPGLHDLVKLEMDVRYGLHHLAAHLEAAGREDDLNRLMQLEWTGHQGGQTLARFENTWYTMHERVGDTSGYLSDVDRAWRLAERPYAGRQSSSDIGLQCRYALIFTSLCSLAGNIPPALLVALVEKGIWPGPQGLTYARQIQKPELRSRALAALAPYLGPTERDQARREALKAAWAIEYDWPRSQALAALAPHLTAPLLREALEAARATGDEKTRSEALAALAPHLTAPLLPEALEAALAIGDEENRSEVLAALAPRLVELGHLAEALAAALAIEDKWSRSQALAALAPRLAELGHLAEALAAALAIGDEKNRSQVLAALAPRLAATEHDQVLREALAAALAIGDEKNRCEVLAALAPSLAPTERDQALREALEVARAIWGEWPRSQALAALASRLAPTERDQALREALAAARAIGDERYRSRALAALAPRLAELPPATLSPLWSKTIRLSTTRSRWSLQRDLMALLPLLTASGGAEAVAETCRAIQDVGRWWP